jgi:hypothetical protein
MVKFMKGALLAGVATFALSSVASAQAVTDAEFKCQTSVSKAGSKFVGSKSKCASKCISNASKGVNPYSDCYAPYAGSTLLCITNPPLRKGAEEKFEDAIRKACDPSFKAGTDCPECYSGGDCTTEAADRVQNVEGQVDSFGPGVFCEQTPSADKLELGCELNTAKVLSKLVASINKCYDKCNANQRKGVIPAGSCNAPSPTDATTSTCLNTANSKSIAGIDKKCTDAGAIPDCNTTDDYPNGTAWVNLVDLAISGNVPGTYCASPSGAFIQ